VSIERKHVEVLFIRNEVLITRSVCILYSVQWERVISK